MIHTHYEYIGHIKVTEHNDFRFVRFLSYIVFDSNGHNQELDNFRDKSGPGADLHFRLLLCSLRYIPLTTNIHRSFIPVILEMRSTNIGLYILGLACILLHLLNSKFIPTAECHTTNHIRRNTFLHRVYVSNETISSSKRTMTTGRLSYHGGHLIPNIKVVLILWGGSSKV